MIFPKVSKRFGRLAAHQKVRRAAVRAASAVVAIAAVVTASPQGSRANTVDQGFDTANLSRVITLPTAPGLVLVDGTTTIMATHYSHSSHASHASHTSHCSGYSYC